MDDGLPILEFVDGPALESWLEEHHGSSPGIWLRIFKQRSGKPSVSFEEVLELGIRFGWSESQRRGLDEVSYLQRFTPRRRRGTASPRNRAIAERLLAEGKMTPAGLEALGWDR